MTAEVLPIAYWVCCPELAFVDCGGAALGQLGLSPGEVLGSKLHDFFRGAENAEEAVRIHTAALNGAAGSFSTSWGGNVWHCSVSTIERGGEVVGVSAVAVDCTDAGQKSAFLADRCLQQQTMMDQAPVFLMHVDYLGRLTMANAPALEWLDVNLADAEMQPVEQLLGEDLKSLFAGAIDEAAHGRTASLTVELNHSGSLQWFETTISPTGKLSRQGRGGYVLLMVDITERVLAERQRLRQAERLTARQRIESLGMMAAGVAHDFNNLLAAIVGHTGVALMEFDGDPEVIDHLESIDEAAKRASDLCRQLMLYSGDGELTLVPVAVDDAIRKTMRVFDGTFDKSIEVRVNVPNGLPLISGNIVELRRIFTNLVRNGVDAMSGGGVLTVDAVVRRCSTEEWDAATTQEQMNADQYVVITVSDTGCGMDEATRTRLFEPFFTTKPDGHGLGIASVLGAVRSHGGALRVESEKGVGSSFFIYLPVCPSVNKMDVAGATEVSVTGP